jgi:peptidoglycan/LPS O-acetylase OafA/YrhL
MRWRLGRCPALDGLRGLAILLVMLGHSPLPGVGAAGQVGVTVFFTLSGFLITALLLEELVDTSRVRLAQFYARRALRLLPALVVFLGAMALLTLASDLALAPNGLDLLGSLFYVGNLTTAMQGRDTVVSHTWSLAIEEQFYIVWPLALVVVLRCFGRRHLLMMMAALGSLTAIVERLLLWDDGHGTLRVTFGADTRMDALLVGCLAAAWLFDRPRGRNQPHVATAALAIAAAFMVTAGVGERLVLPTVVPWLTAVAILVVVQQPYDGWLARPSLRLLGRRSYALYLWHYPLWGVATAVAWPAVVPVFVGVSLLAAAIVHLSWQCVELPFLRRKPAHAVAPAVSVPGVEVGATVR